MIEKYNNKYIGILEYFTLVVFLSRSFFNGIGFQKILSISKQDTWIVIITSLVFGIFFMGMIYLFNKKNILESNNKVINFILLIFVIVSFMIILNDFITFASLKYLFETSNYFIAFLILFPSLYIVNKGLETIGRTSLFMFFISILLFMINCIVLFKYIDFNNLKPMLVLSNNNFFSSLIHTIIYTISPILILNIIPKNNCKKINLCFIFGYIISTLSILIIFFYITTVYNYKYMDLFNYPAYFILRKAEYKLIANGGNVLSLFFIIDYFFTITIYLYLIKYISIKIFNYKNNIFYYAIIIICSFLSIILLSNIIIKNIILNNILIYLLGFFMCFYILILYKKKLKKIKK